MRLLLINSNTRDDLLAAPPIGLSYVATVAEGAGHDVRVLDLCFRSDRHSLVRDALQSFSPEAVGISVRNIDNVNMLYPVLYLPDVKDLVAEVRRYSQAPIIVGGSGASLCPTDVLRALEVEYVVVSDGERTLLRLLDAMQGTAPLADIPGLAFWQDGHPALHPPNFPALDSGDPRLGKWIDLGPYSKRGASYNVQTKRGCTQRCIYCTYNQALEGAGMRLRAPAEVVDEIEKAVTDYAPECFEFVDSVFNHPYGHCVELLEEILRRPWKTRFTAMGVSPRKLDARLLDLMWRAGFRSFMMSPETASPQMITNYGKGFTADDLMTATEAVLHSRFTVLYYFLIGGPGETHDTVQESIDFAQRYLTKAKRPPYTMANFYLGIRVYPNTVLWNIAVDQGLFPPGADPLQQLWYISEHLDLDRVVRQLTGAASKAPEISLGFDERYLIVSRVISLMGDLFKMPKPYWRHYWGANNLLVRTRLRSLLQPRDVPNLLRQRLARQGYQGPLLHRSST